MIAIRVNGKLQDVAQETSITGFLDSQKINPATVVVEVNMVIVKKELYGDYRFAQADVVEILRFVGGG